MSCPRIPVLLLIALPASGKSEVRKCLKMIQKDQPDEFARLGIGETVDLDDFPYVDFMRLTDLARFELGLPPIFFDGPKGGFRDSRDWLTLIHLLNEDFEGLTEPKPSLDMCAAALDLFDRFDRADAKAGIAPRFAALRENRIAMATAIVWWATNPEHKGMSAGKKLVKNSYFWRVPSLDDKTVVIEFSRGIPKDTELPAPFPFGYRYSLAAIHPDIFEMAFILYIKVNLEDSIRKDEERATPPPGCEDSTMYHGLPTAVRDGAYWGDDFDDLLDDDGWAWSKNEDGCPAAIFDNTGIGCTDIFRLPEDKWTPEAVAPAAAKLKAAFAELLRIGD